MSNPHRFPSFPLETLEQDPLHVFRESMRLPVAVEEGGIVVGYVLGTSLMNAILKKLEEGEEMREELEALARLESMRAEDSNTAMLNRLSEPLPSNDDDHGEV